MPWLSEQSLCQVLCASHQVRRPSQDLSALEEWQVPRAVFLHLLAPQDQIAELIHVMTLLPDRLKPCCTCADEYMQQGEDLSLLQQEGNSTEHTHDMQQYCLCCLVGPKRQLMTSTQFQYHFQQTLSPPVLERGMVMVMCKVAERLLPSHGAGHETHSAEKCVKYRLCS